MNTSASWLSRVRAQTQTALASGALQPMQSEEERFEEAGLCFSVRWLSTLAQKDAAKPAAMPGGVRNPDFNPFLSPEPALTIGYLADHAVILNKFPVCEHHLVLARREFEEQLMPLSRSDFAVMVHFLVAEGGLGFYNGGAAAGASQRHKHVQWIPAADGNASLKIWQSSLPEDAEFLTTYQHDALKMQHCFVRVNCDIGCDESAAVDSVVAGFERACAELKLSAGDEGLFAPFNVLLGSGWLLVIPRREEKFAGVPMSAVCFGGTLFVREREQFEPVRQHGVLAALAAVGFAR